MACEMVGVACEMVGVVREMVGVVCEMVGVACEMVGVVCKTMGVVCEMVGVVCKTMGVVCEMVGVACETVGAFMALVHDPRVHILSSITLSLKNEVMEKVSMKLVTYLKAHLIENQTHCVIKHTNPVCVCVYVCVCMCVCACACVCVCEQMSCLHGLPDHFHTYLFQLNSTFPSSLS